MSEEAKNTDGANQDPNEQCLLTIDKETLTPLVRSALSSDTVDVIDWEYLSIYGGYGGARIYRFTGNASDGDENVEWSLILKIIPTSFDSEHPFVSSDFVSSDDVRAILHEPLVYQSGFLNDLPYGLAAPRCFSVVEHPDGTFWLWLEDVKDEIGEWPLERYGFTAHQFGQFNGSYLTGQRTLPSLLMKTDIHRKWASVSRRIEQLPDSLEHPLVCCAFPPELANELIRLWADHEVFLDALDSLPQTFCHHDVHRGNMFARCGVDGREQTVMIDWQGAGMGAIGGEMGSFISKGFVLDPEPGAAQELDKTVFDGYLAGLHDVGWRDDTRIVRLGCLAVSILRWMFICPGFILQSALDESRHTEFEQRFERSMEEVMVGFANPLRFHLELADEARRLLDSIC